MAKCNSLKLLLLLGIMLARDLARGHPVPQNEEQSVTEVQKQNISEVPAMLAVSSTVIPVSSIFGNPKPAATGTGEIFPYFPTFAYSRRSRFFDKSSKPDTPVRLITKISLGLSIILIRHSLVKSSSCQYGIYFLEAYNTRSRFPMKPIIMNTSKRGLICKCFDEHITQAQKPNNDVMRLSMKRK